MVKLLPVLKTDSRERRPFDFSGDPDFAGSITEKLDAGDYTIVGLENLISIERKASADELLNNFATKASRERLCREMERFQAIKYKFIVIEQDLADILNPMSYYINKSGRSKFAPGMPPAVVMKQLIEFMFEYGIHVIFAGPHAQNITKRLLLQAYKIHGNSQRSSD